MPISGSMEYFPLWGLFATTIVVVGLSIEAGYWLGQYRRRTSEEEKEAPVGAIVGATLGLMGFILVVGFHSRPLLVDQVRADDEPKTDDQGDEDRSKRHSVAPTS